MCGNHTVLAGMEISWDHKGPARGFGYTVSWVFYSKRYSVFFAKMFRYRVFCVTIILVVCYQHFCILKVYWYPRGKKWGILVSYYPPPLVGLDMCTSHTNLRQADQTNWCQFIAQNVPGQSEVLKCLLYNRNKDTVPCTHPLSLYLTFHVFVHRTEYHLLSWVATQC